MDTEKLEAYRSNVAERRELQAKLANLGKDDSCIGNSVILDYRKGYPQPQPVVGYDLDLEKRRRERWWSRLAKLQEEIDEVETWIEAIPDGVTRRCFRMYYVEGLSQKQIEKKAHIDQSTVSKKMRNYMKVALQS